mmetsp:Transcript_27336/g.68630  ORF Transcript_27336/g.68630 Transcript_27336/m.68630 type:complete len:438 (+) Transcript_27336:261-1574(+)|eukprot:CAMPEP_0177643478 /NCGR_PEP_ID=MMETSP0447-20121125/8175_1 /TAXON_ID=0 /ORGANISM="Stygamoeba regulata, Strain BSH-02190019" /LENGTH=437 /DNA_ID=CAMNT_0019145773 /DNA_START=254 /DNA_END=1567 /DNA_ORIENTATION=-
MLGGLFFINQKGEVLINRIFRDDVSRGVAETFRIEVIGAKDIRSPIKTLANTTYCHIRAGNVWVVAVTTQNANTATIFEIMYKLVDIFKAYLGDFNEDTINGNFVLVYEVLDEIMDFGYPQTTVLDALKLYIMQAGKKLGKGGVKDAEKLAKMTVQVTGAISWRSQGIKYRKNEIFIDAVESVNILVSAKGQLLRSDVSGQVLMKCYLSGMPECKFGMNDKLVMEKEKTVMRRGAGAGRRGEGIEMDDCTFHQCVKLNKFDTDRTISFVPPDGEFELMKYRITEHINIPFRILPMVREIGRTRVEMQVTIKTNFSSKMIGQGVVVKIPTPRNTSTCKINASYGKAKYTPTEDAIVWRIRKFPGESEQTLSAEVQLIASVSEKKAWSRPPISMHFTVPMFTASGLHVRFLKVVEPKLQYQTVKWVRYVTRAGQYQHRF